MGGGGGEGVRVRGGGEEEVRVGGGGGEGVRMRGGGGEKVGGSRGIVERNENGVGERTLQQVQHRKAELG